MDIADDKSEPGMPEKKKRVNTPPQRRVDAAAGAVGCQEAENILGGPISSDSEDEEEATLAQATTTPATTPVKSRERTKKKTKKASHDQSRPGESSELDTG